MTEKETKSLCCLSTFAWTFPAASAEHFLAFAFLATTFQSKECVMTGIEGLIIYQLPVHFNFVVGSLLSPLDLCNTPSSSTQTLANTHRHAHKQTYTCTRTNIQTYTHACAHIHTHTLTHTHTNTQTHACTNTHSHAYARMRCAHDGLRQIPSIASNLTCPLIFQQLFDLVTAFNRSFRSDAPHWQRHLQRCNLKVIFDALSFSSSEISIGGYQGVQLAFTDTLGTCAALTLNFQAATPQPIASN